MLPRNADRVSQKPECWREDFPVPMDRERHVCRRQFARVLWLLPLTFLTGTFAAATRTLWPRLRLRSTPETPVAGVEEVPVGGYKLFRYPTEDEPCILLRLGDEDFVAFSQSCTHLTCPVYFDSANNHLRCPCHHGCFSAHDGSPVSGPPRRSLPRLEVSIRKGQVLVRPPQDDQVLLSRI